MECTGDRYWEGRKVRCGKCPGCRKLAAWVKSRRIALESLEHRDERSWFFTLTFRSVPEDKGYALVQLWLKRVRKAVHPRKVRFVCVLEHGAKNDRAHYHGFLWSEDLIRYRNIPAWEHGFYKYLVATPATWSYIAKYIAKEGGKVRGSKDLGVGILKQVSDNSAYSAIVEHFAGARITRVAGVRVPRVLSDRFVALGKPREPVPEESLTRDELLSFSIWSHEDD